PPVASRATPRPRRGPREPDEGPGRIGPSARRRPGRVRRRAAGHRGAGEWASQGSRSPGRGGGARVGVAQGAGVGAGPAGESGEGGRGGGRGGAEVAGGSEGEVGAGSRRSRERGPASEGGTGGVPHPRHGGK